MIQEVLSAVRKLRLAIATGEKAPAAGGFVRIAVLNERMRPWLDSREWDTLRREFDWACKTSDWRDYCELELEFLERALIRRTRSPRRIRIEEGYNGSRG